MSVNTQSIKQYFFTVSKQRIVLENLLSLLEDGIALTKALEVMVGLSSGSESEAIDAMIYSIASGQGMAAGMTGWFSAIYVELARAGEQSGQLVDALSACVAQVSKTSDSIRACISALFYPFIVLLAALGVIVFVKTAVLQQFAAIKSVASWPDAGQTLYNLAQWLESYWLLLVCAVLFVFWLLFVCCREVTGPWRTRLDHLPLFKLYRQLTAARFMQALGLLLKNGIMLKNALVLLQNRSRSYLNWHLLRMEMQLANGQLNVAEVLDTQLLDLSDMQRLRILATGSGFVDALQRLGEQSIEKKMRHLVRLANWLGGLLLLGGASLAMLLIFGLYSVSQVLAT